MRERATKAAEGWPSLLFTTASAAGFGRVHARRRAVVSGKTKLEGPRQLASVYLFSCNDKPDTTPALSNENTGTGSREQIDLPA